MGPAGIRGVFRNSKGDVVLMFSKHVGVCDSNEVEVLAILEDLRLLSTRYSGALVLESDYLNAIESVCMADVLAKQGVDRLMP